METQYWNQFYANPDECILTPSSFALHVQKQIPPNSNILDIGCGNCRDSLFFAQQGHSVTAIDTSLDTSTPNIQHKNLQLSNNNALSYLSNTNNTYNVIYMRWFLHALPLDQQQEIILYASKQLSKNGGTIWIENRSINDTILLQNSTYSEIDGSYTTSHKRWPTSETTLKNMFQHSLCEIISIQESRGFSDGGQRDYNQDPLLFRIEAKRKPSIRISPTPANIQNPSWTDKFNILVNENKQSITIIRTDSQSKNGWGQPLALWASLDDQPNQILINVGPSNKNKKNILISDIRKKEKKSQQMIQLLNHVSNILLLQNIPYHLDCGTLLGFIRQGSVLNHDSDIDISVPLHLFNTLSEIDWKIHGLELRRTHNFNTHAILSVAFPENNMYCDIYFNPKFPKITPFDKYFIPTHSHLYLTQLYGNWKLPSSKHAAWPNLWIHELPNGPYKIHFDENI